MTEQSTPLNTAGELLADFHACESAYLHARTELTDYIGSLIGSNVQIEGFTSKVVMASAVTPEGEVKRRTMVSTFRRFNFFEEDGDEPKLARAPLVINRARIDSINQKELSVSLTDIEPPFVQYQALGYVFNLSEITKLIPVPTIVK